MNTKPMTQADHVNTVVALEDVGVTVGGIVVVVVSGAGNNVAYATGASKINWDSPSSPQVKLLKNIKSMSSVPPHPISR